MGAEYTNLDTHKLVAIQKALQALKSDLLGCAKRPEFNEEPQGGTRGTQVEEAMTKFKNFQAQAEGILERASRKMEAMTKFMNFQAQAEGI